MKSVECGRCGASVAMSEAYEVRGRTHCRSCTAALMKDPVHPVLETEVHPLSDPTICAGCRANDTQDLPLVDGRPLCKDCRKTWIPAAGLRFPLRIKLFFLGLLVLTGASFLHSWRFIGGYVAFKRGSRAMDRREVPRAAELMEAAARQVPEDAGFRGLAACYRGLALFDQDRTKEGLIHLKRAQQELPDAEWIHKLVLRLEASEAFEAKDYRGFIQKIEAYQKLEGGTYEGLSSLASARACRYALDGKEEDRRETLALLEQARKASDLNAKDLEAFEPRMLYRLETREILDKKAFEARFPQGWKPTTRRPS